MELTLFPPASSTYRAEDFKDSVRRAAVSDGYDEVRVTLKVASTLASFITRKSQGSDPLSPELLSKR
ncbi:unnamed protein product [Brassica oleracea var. botrytis]